jgi:hypothetical protein
MSEYQYYEFQALDRPLTREEQRAVAKLSSRVGPHPRRAVFVYNYSDFPAYALKVLAQYYDAMFYLANWGSCQLAFRFPSASVDVGAMRRYAVVTTDAPSEAVAISAMDDDVIVSLRVDDEEGFGWVEGEGWLDQMVGLRAALMRRDYRVLYLAWLKGITIAYDVDEDAVEPPVPAGLRERTAALDYFVERFRIPQDLLSRAAERSPALASPEFDATEARRRIAALSPEVKDAFLLRLAQNEAHLATAFRERLELLCDSDPADATPRRTVGDLLRAWR